MDVAGLAGAPTGSAMRSKLPETDSSSGGDGGQERLAGVAHPGEPFRQGRIRDQLGQLGPPGSGLAGEVRDPSLRMLGSHA